MITVDKGKLKFLLAGRPVQVERSRELRKGRIYPVGLAGKRQSICRAMVLDQWSPEPGVWRLTIRHAAAEVPRMLAARPGGPEGDYTSRPDRAAPGEPEALSEADLERYAVAARNEHEERRRDEASRRPRTARIAALERAAEAGDQQAKRHLFVIDQRIQAHERGIPRSQNG